MNNMKKRFANKWIPSIEEIKLAVFSVQNEDDLKKIEHVLSQSQERSNRWLERSSHEDCTEAEVAKFTSIIENLEHEHDNFPMGCFKQEDFFRLLQPKWPSEVNELCLIYPGYLYGYLVKSEKYVIRIALKFFRDLLELLDSDEDLDFLDHPFTFSQFVIYSCTYQVHRLIVDIKQHLSRFWKLSTEFLELEIAIRYLCFDFEIHEEFLTLQNLKSSVLDEDISLFENFAKAKKRFISCVVRSAKGLFSEEVLESDREKEIFDGLYLGSFGVPSERFFTALKGSKCLVDYFEGSPRNTDKNYYSRYWFEDKDRTLMYRRTFKKKFTIQIRCMRFPKIFPFDFVDLGDGNAVVRSPFFSYFPFLIFREGVLVDATENLDIFYYGHGYLWLPGRRILYKGLAVGGQNSETYDILQKKMNEFGSELKYNNFKALKGGFLCLKKYNNHLSNRFTDVVFWKEHHLVSNWESSSSESNRSAIRSLFKREDGKLSLSFSYNQNSENILVQKLYEMKHLDTLEDFSRCLSERYYGLLYYSRLDRYVDEYHPDTHFLSFPKVYQSFIIRLVHMNSSSLSEFGKIPQDVLFYKIIPFLSVFDVFFSINREVIEILKVECLTSVDDSWVDSYGDEQIEEDVHNMKNFETAFLYDFLTSITRLRIQVDNLSSIQIDYQKIGEFGKRIGILESMPSCEVYEEIEVEGENGKKHANIKERVLFKFHSDSLLPNIFKHFFRLNESFSERDGYVVSLIRIELFRLFESLISVKEVQSFHSRLKLSEVEKIITSEVKVELEPFDEVLGKLEKNYELLFCHPLESFISSIKRSLFNLSVLKRKFPEKLGDIHIKVIDKINSLFSTQSKFVRNNTIYFLSEEKGVTDLRKKNRVNMEESSRMKVIIDIFRTYFFDFLIRSVRFESVSQSTIPERENTIRFCDEKRATLCFDTLINITETYFQFCSKREGFKIIDSVCALITDLLNFSVEEEEEEEEGEEDEEAEEKMEEEEEEEEGEATQSDLKKYPFVGFFVDFLRKRGEIFPFLAYFENEVIDVISDQSRGEIWESEKIRIDLIATLIRRIPSADFDLFLKPIFNTFVEQLLAIPHHLTTFNMYRWFQLIKELMFSKIPSMIDEGSNNSMIRRFFSGRCEDQTVHIVRHPFEIVEYMLIIAHRIAQRPNSVKVISSLNCMLDIVWKIYDLRQEVLGVVEKKEFEQENRMLVNEILKLLNSISKYSFMEYDYQNEMSEMVFGVMDSALKLFEYFSEHNFFSLYSMFDSRGAIRRVKSRESFEHWIEEINFGKFQTSREILGVLKVSNNNQKFVTFLLSEFDNLLKTFKHNFEMERKESPRIYHVHSKARIDGGREMFEWYVSLMMTKKVSVILKPILLYQFLRREIGQEESIFSKNESNIQHLASLALSCLGTIETGVSTSTRNLQRYILSFLKVLLEENHCLMDSLKNEISSFITETCKIIEALDSHRPFIEYGFHDYNDCDRVSGILKIVINDFSEIFPNTIHLYSHMLIDSILLSASHTKYFFPDGLSSLFLSLEKEKRENRLQDYLEILLRILSETEKESKEQEKEAEKVISASTNKDVYQSPYEKVIRLNGFQIHSLVNKLIEGCSHCYPHCVPENVEEMLFFILFSSMALNFMNNKRHCRRVFPQNVKKLFSLLVERGRVEVVRRCVHWETVEKFFLSEDFYQRRRRRTGGDIFYEWKRKEVELCLLLFKKKEEIFYSCEDEDGKNGKRYKYSEEKLNIMFTKLKSLPPIPEFDFSLNESNEGEKISTSGLSFKEKEVEKKYFQKCDELILLFIDELKKDEEGLEFLRILFPLSSSSSLEVFHDGKPLMEFLMNHQSSLKKSISALIGLELINFEESSSLSMENTHSSRRRRRMKKNKKKDFGGYKVNFLQSSENQSTDFFNFNNENDDEVIFLPSNNPEVVTKPMRRKKIEEKEEEEEFFMDFSIFGNQNNGEEKEVVEEEDSTTKVIEGNQSTPIQSMVFDFDQNRDSGGLEGNMNNNIFTFDESGVDGDEQREEEEVFGFDFQGGGDDDSIFTFGDNQVFSNLHEEKKE